MFRKMRNNLIVYLVLIMLLSLIDVPSFVAEGNSMVYQQSFQENALRGRLIDQDSKKSIESASVTLTVKQNEMQYRTKTDTFGMFKITGLEPGLYTLEASHPGYYSASEADFLIEDNKSNTWDKQLVPKEPGLDLFLEVACVKTGLQLQNVPVTITVTPSKGGADLSYTSYTDETGFLHFPNLPGGFYHFSVNEGADRVPGWESYTISESKEIKSTHWADVLLKPDSSEVNIRVRGFDPTMGDGVDNYILGGVMVEVEGLHPEDHDLVIVPAQIGVSGIYKAFTPGWDNDMWGWVKFTNLMAIDWRITGKRLGYHVSERIIRVDEEGNLTPDTFALNMELQDTRITAVINTPYSDHSLVEGLTVSLQGLKDTNTAGIYRTRQITYNEIQDRPEVVFDKILPGNYLLTVDDTVTKTVPILVEGADVQGSKPGGQASNRFTVHFKGTDYVDAFGDVNHEVEIFLEPQPMTLTGTLESARINMENYKKHSRDSYSSRFSRAVDWDVKTGQKVEIRASEYYAQYMPEEYQFIEVETDNTGTFTVSLLPGLYGFASPGLDDYFGAALTLDDLDRGMEWRRKVNWPYYQEWPHSKESLEEFMGWFEFPFYTKWYSSYTTPGGVGGMGLSSGENLAGYFLLAKKEILLDVSPVFSQIAREFFFYNATVPRSITNRFFHYEGDSYFSITGPENFSVGFDEHSDYTSPILINKPGTYTIEFEHPDYDLVGSSDMHLGQTIASGDTFEFFDFPNPGLLPATPFPEDYGLDIYDAVRPMQHIRLSGIIKLRETDPPDVIVYNWNSIDQEYVLVDFNVAGWNMHVIAYQYSAINNKYFNRPIPSAMSQPYSRVVRVRAPGFDYFNEGPDDPHIDYHVFKLHSESLQEIYVGGSGETTPMPWSLTKDPDTCTLGLDYNLIVQVRDIDNREKLLQGATITYNRYGFVESISLPGWVSSSSSLQYKDGGLLHTAYMTRSNYLGGEIISKETGEAVPYANVTVISPQNHRVTLLAAGDGTFGTDTTIPGGTSLNNSKHLLEVQADGFEPYWRVLDPADATPHPDYDDVGLFFLTGADAVKVTPLEKPLIDHDTLTMDRWGAFLPGIKKSGNQSVFDKFEADGPLTMTWALDVAPGQQEYSFTVPTLNGSTEPLILQDEIAEVWLIDRKAFTKNSYDEDYQSIIIAEDLEPHAFRDILKNIREEKPGFKNVFYQRLTDFTAISSESGAMRAEGLIKLWQLPPDLFQPAFVVITKMGAVNVYNFEYTGAFAGKELTGARLPAWFAGMADIMGTVAGSEALLEDGLASLVPKGKFVPLPSFTANIVQRASGALDYVYSIDTKITEGVTNDKGGILGFAPGILGLSLYGGAEATLKGEDREFYLQLKGGISPTSVQEKDYTPNMLKKLGVDVKLLPPPSGEFYHIDSYIFDADNKPHELAVLYGMSGQLGLEMAKDITPIMKYIPKAGPILYKISKMTDLKLEAIMKSLGGVRSLSGFKTTFPHEAEHYYDYPISGETNQLRRHFLGGDEVGDPVQDSSPEKTEDIINFKRLICDLDPVQDPEPEKTKSLDMALGFGLGLRVEALKRMGAQGTIELAGDDAWTGAPAMLIDINPHGDYPIVERVRGDLRAELTAYIKAWSARYQKKWTWKAWPIDYQFGTESVMYLIELEIFEDVKGLADFEPVEFTGETPVIVDKFLPLGVYKGVGGSAELLLFSDMDDSIAENMSLKVATIDNQGLYNQPIEVCTVEGGIVAADIVELPGGGGWMAVWTEIDREHAYSFFPGTKIMYSISDPAAANWSLPAVVSQFDTEVAEYLKLVFTGDQVALAYARTGDGPVGGDYALEFTLWDGDSWSEPEQIKSSTTLTDFDATGSDNKIHLAYTDQKNQLTVSTWSQGTPLSKKTFGDAGYSIALASNSLETYLVYTGKEGGIGFMRYDAEDNTWLHFNVENSLTDALPLELSLSVITEDEESKIAVLWTQNPDGEAVNLYYSIINSAGEITEETTGLTNFPSGGYHSPAIYQGQNNNIYFMGVYEEAETIQLYSFLMGEAIPESHRLAIEIEGMGTTEPAEGYHYYNTDESIELRATPAQGWKFIKWVVNGQEFHDAEIMITIDEDKTAKAYFITTVDPHKKAADAVNSLFDDEDNLIDGVTQEDIDDAMGLVLDIEDGEAKTALLLKLEKAQYQLNERQNTIKYGDVTGDGNVVVADAILVLRHIVGLITLDGDQISRAKVSGGGGELAVGDAILILRYIVGLIDVFPVEE